jgi:hypothetical protein
MTTTATAADFSHSPWKHTWHKRTTTGGSGFLNGALVSRQFSVKGRAVAEESHY